VKTQSAISEKALSWQSTNCSIDGSPASGEQLPESLRANPKRKSDVMVIVSNPLSSEAEISAASDLRECCMRVIYEEGNLTPGVDLRFVRGDVQTDPHQFARILIAKDQPQGWTNVLVPRPPGSSIDENMVFFGADANWAKPGEELAHVVNGLMGRKNKNNLHTDEFLQAEIPR